MKLRALNNKILCKEMEQGEQLSRGGIILMNDDASEGGIRPRWMQVVSVGPEVCGISPDQWIMVEHGRWTHGMVIRDGDDKFTIWGAELESVLLVADEKPEIERSESTAN